MMKKEIILAIVNFLAKIHILTPINVARLKHFYKFHRIPNYENPKDLNEKMNWIKFYGDTSKWADLADKYKVRKFIESKGLGDTLVKLYGKWDYVEQIDWNSLPNQFIMKMNNGSGDVIICKDKREIDIEASKKEIPKLFAIEYGITTGEPHYAKIKPCVIAEELLDATLQPIPTSSLIDYKIWCFNGKVAYIWVCYNRTKDVTDVGVYDTDWNYHKELSVFTHHYREGKPILPKPQCLDKMIACASKLSEGFPVLRCDLYEVDGKVYFGEMTFTSLGGFMDFYTQGFLDEMGKMVDLSIDKNWHANRA